MEHGPRMLAAGRASEILALDVHRVLRQTRPAADLTWEAEVMRYARDRGFPVPRVLEVRPDGLVLERISGPTMGADLVHHPWRAQAHARALADLHRRLHRLPPPPGVPARYGLPRERDVLLHGDLHPLNVLLSPRGPVVIDWTNAGRGPAGADVADTWLMLATSRLPGSPFSRAIVGTVRRRFLQHFLLSAGRQEAATWLPAAAAVRGQDPHVAPAERVAISALAHRHGRATE